MKIPPRKKIKPRKPPLISHGRPEQRKVIHIAIGMFGFLYAFFSFEIILFVWIIATFCAWFLPARVEALEPLLTQQENKRGFSLAMISYGLIMAAGTLIFQNKIMDAVILQAVIAFGDGFSALVGMNYRGTPIFYNQNKSWVGTMSFVIFGTLGALALVFFFGVFSIHIPFEPRLGSLPIFRILLIMSVCAIVESINWKMPDNIPVGIAAIGALLLTGKLNH